MKIIRKIHKANISTMLGLPLQRALPAESLPHIDPFLLLDHVGPIEMPPNNHGLPEKPHPHRGIQTVTFVLDGELEHLDNIGNEGLMYPGTVEWLSIGRGIMHAADVSERFKKNGGTLEIIQLWVNLPATDKMSEPKFAVAHAEDIPELPIDHGKVTIRLVSGNLQRQQSALGDKIGVSLNEIRFKKGGMLTLDISGKQSVLFYLIRGSLKVNGVGVSANHLVEFNQQESKITIKATDDSLLLFGQGTPTNEPVISKGPFVMNSDLEIRQAFRDYREGKFGEWNSKKEVAAAQL